MTRAPGAASTSIATVLSASTAPKSKRGRRGGADALALPAERFEYRQPRRAEAGCRQKFGQRGRPVAIGGESQNARAGLQMRADEIERSAMQREQSGLRQRPAEPRRGQAEGRRRRHDVHLARIDVARQHAPTP